MDNMVLAVGDKDEKYIITDYNCIFSELMDNHENAKRLVGYYIDNSSSYGEFLGKKSKKGSMTLGIGFNTKVKSCETLVKLLQDEIKENPKGDLMGNVDTDIKTHLGVGNC